MDRQPLRQSKSGYDLPQWFRSRPMLCALAARDREKPAPDQPQQAAAVEP
jgi:hypothetical protein